MLEQLKRRLREQGIDCAQENTYATNKSLAVDPRNPKVLYVGVEGRGVYTSKNQGITWKKITNGLVAYPDRANKRELCFPDLAHIFIDPTNTQRLLLVTGDITTAYVDWPYGETGGIWESRDSGESWKQIISGSTNVASSGSLAVDPKDPRVMYYPVNPDPPTFLEAPIKTSLTTKGSVYKTRDGGNTWEELTMPMLPGLQATSIFINPKNTSHLRLLTQSHDHVYSPQGGVQEEVLLRKQHGILETFDGGKTWAVLGERLPAPYRAIFDGDVAKRNFSHLIVRPFLFGREFPADRAVQKSFYSVDGGKSFHETPLYIWVGRFNPHDASGNHLLGYAMMNGQVVESRDAGATWEPVSTPPEVRSQRVRISHIVWDPVDRNTVYLSGEYGNVWQSRNGGASWQNILNLTKLPK